MNNFSTVDDLCLWNIILSLRPCKRTIALVVDMPYVGLIISNLVIGLLNVANVDSLVLRVSWVLRRSLAVTLLVHDRAYTYL